MASGEALEKFAQPLLIPDVLDVTRSLSMSMDVLTLRYSTRTTTGSRVLNSLRVLISPPRALAWPGRYRIFEQHLRANFGVRGVEPVSTSISINFC
jgi:hypothetical protein